MLILGLVILSGMGMFVPFIIGGQMFLGRSLDTSLLESVQDVRHEEMFYFVINSLHQRTFCWSNLLCAAGRTIANHEDAKLTLRYITL